MKNFILKLVFFIMILIMSITLLYILGISMLNNSDYYKLSDNKKYVVLGHSHPECAFNDSIINNLSNFSNSGETYFYTYLKLKKLIQFNKQLKVAFIEFSNNQITTEMDAWTWSDEYLPIRLPTYLPLMDYSDFKLLREKNSKGIRTYFLRSIFKNIAHNYLSIIRNTNCIKNDDGFGGYYYRTKSVVDSLIKLPKKIKRKTNFEISSTNIKYLTKIIELCKNNNVQIFLIRSPLHKKYYGLDNELSYRKILESKFKNIDFLDFKDYPLKNEEFYDLHHLNNKGATVFSVWFNNLLNNNFLKKSDKQAFLIREIDDLKLAK